MQSLQIMNYQGEQSDATVGSAVMPALLAHPVNRPSTGCVIRPSVHDAECHSTPPRPWPTLNRSDVACFIKCCTWLMQTSVRCVTSHELVALMQNWHIADVGVLMHRSVTGRGTHTQLSYLEPLMRV
jgi:hypothetical protein